MASTAVKGSKRVKTSKSKVLMDDTENQDVGDVHRKKKVISFVCLFIVDEYRNIICNQYFLTSHRN